MSQPLPEIVFHVFPTDCDMLGHLNHATMLSFLERARWALLEPHLCSDWHQQAVFPVVRHVDIGYTAQTLPGEDLVIRSGLLSVGRTSWTVQQEARKADHGRLVASAKMVFVAVNRDGLPVAVPESWLALLPAWPSE